MRHMTRRDTCIDTLIDSLVVQAIKTKTVQGVTPILLKYSLENYVFAHTINGVYYGLPVYKVMNDTILHEEKTKR